MNGKESFTISNTLLLYCFIKFLIISSILYMQKCNDYMVAICRDKEDLLRTSPITWFVPMTVHKPLAAGRNWCEVSSADSFIHERRERGHNTFVICIVYTGYTARRCVNAAADVRAPPSCTRDSCFVLHFCMVFIVCNRTGWKFLLINVGQLAARQVCGKSGNLAL